MSSSSARRSFGTRRRGFWGVTPTAATTLTSAALVLTLAACQANPGEAPTVEDPSASTQTQQPQPVDESLREITVGVDRFTGNLNPHLVGNRNPVVAAVADLTLPSVYTDGSMGENLNVDLISEVKPNDREHPTEVVYTLRPEAQWSDGTPITISDFQYLSKAMVDEPLAEAKGLYRHITSIEPEKKEKSFKVTFDKPLSTWKRLFTHLLPSHIYRAEGRSFDTMMDGGSVASAGQFSVKSVDEGRGLLELQRNDRYWGSKAAKTDIIRFTAVPDVSTGAQMMRTQQIQMYMTHRTATTDLALNQLPYTQMRNTARGVQLNLQLNQASPIFVDQEVRRRVLGVINAERIARIVSQDPEVEAPHWNVTPKTTTEMPRDLQSEERPDGIVIGAVTDDQVAVDAARFVVDQLLHSGIPATVRTGNAGEILGSAVEKGEIDGVVTWQRSPQATFDYVEQYGCTTSPEEEGSLEPSDDSDAKNPAEGSNSGDEGASHSNIPKGGNLSGTCDRNLEERLSKLSEGRAELDGEREKLDERIAEISTVLPLLTDRYTVVTSDRLNGPTPGLEDWPLDNSSSVLISASRWTLSPIEENKRNAAENALQED
ncbi:ABC transporter family substrate-binding protein [uncultured Corynebacterium sp.]|uniref:ABC transporter family substrate-binding protein n=1 Tax=uncultured Corynebacterium sp. TaxID=159447 RepID=UPI0025DE7278|nr:ABC transporter family substrate-binding protein [uncultured Corynebacterium sp.]